MHENCVFYIVLNCVYKPYAIVSNSFKELMIQVRMPNILNDFLFDISNKSNSSITIDKLYYTIYINPQGLVLLLQKNQTFTLYMRKLLIVFKYYSTPH